MSAWIPVLVKRCRSVVTWLNSFSVKSWGSVELANFTELPLETNLTELAPAGLTACSAKIGCSRSAVTNVQKQAVAAGSIRSGQLHKLWDISIRSSSFC